MELKKYIRSIPDYPKKGILFRDITTLIKDENAFAETINQIVERSKKYNFTKIAAIESRGFVIGGPIAYKLNAGFILLRKPNKLPREFYSQHVKLEYGETEIQVHKDAFDGIENVLIIDDLLATGGTAIAAYKLIPEDMVSGFGFMVELSELKGRSNIEKISDVRIESMVVY